MKKLDEIIHPELKPTKEEILQLISLIDLTSLNPLDTQIEIEKLCTIANEGYRQKHPAAVCTYATFGENTQQLLQPGIKTAVVAGCFPSGVTLTKAKVKEVEFIASSDIDEIDVVINRSLFLEGQLDELHKEIVAMKVAAGDKKLKVILETGDFNKQEDIATLSKIVIESGADFIKTSTGKSNKGATYEAVYTMCQIIRDHFHRTGHKIGIKPSGGIRTTTDAFRYYEIVRAVNGKEWLTPALFRIGASSLYHQLIRDHKNA